MIATGDPVLKAIVTNGKKVVGVVHMRRRPNAYQKSALDWLFPTCAAKGCATRACFLETDHREDWAHTHITVLELLDRLCRYHHRLKTTKVGPWSKEQVNETSSPQTTRGTHGTPRPNGPRRLVLARAAHGIARLPAGAAAIVPAWARTATMRARAGAAMEAGPARARKLGSCCGLTERATGRS